MARPRPLGPNKWATIAPSTIGSSLFRQVSALDPIAWHRFVNVYGPVVYYWCRCDGVRGDDIADVGQEVFRAVMQSIDKYERRAGVNFAAWLRTITRNKAVDHHRRQGKRPMVVGGSSFMQRIRREPQAAVDSNDEPYAAEPMSTAEPHDATSRAILAHSALATLKSRFQPNTWNAFWQTAVNDRPSGDVADELGMTPMAVRKAKSRVLRVLRDELTLATDGMVMQDET